jgi:hypothetical protein
VYFVGTGGAHLTYFLRVVLSRDNRSQDFPYLSSELPVLPTGYDPRRAAAPFRPAQTLFTVFRATPQGRPQLFVRLD